MTDEGERLFDAYVRCMNGHTVAQIDEAEQVERDLRRALIPYIGQRDYFELTEGAERLFATTRKLVAIERAMCRHTLLMWGGATLVLAAFSIVGLATVGQGVFDVLFLAFHLVCRFLQRRTLRQPIGASADAEV